MNNEIQSHNNNFPSKIYSKNGVFWGLSSFQMLAMFRRGLFYTFLSIYMRSYLGLSVTVTSLYATLPMFFSSFFQMFVWGKVSDKWQKRRTLIIMGEIIAGILLIFTYLIHASIAEYSKIYAGYVIIAGLSIIEIFWFMSNIGWSALVSDLYPSKERSRIMALLTSIGGIGRIIGVLIGGFLYEGFFKFQYEGWGFREGSLFYISSLFMFLSTIPMIFVPEGGINKKYSILTSFKKEWDQPKEEERKIALNLTNSEEIEKNEINFKKILKIFIIFIISLVFINFGRNSVSVIYSQYLDLENLFATNINSKIIGYIANTRSIATIAIGLFVGSINKKMGNGKTVLLGTILAIIYLILTVITRNLIVVFAASFIAGASEVIIMAAAYAYVAELIPEEKRGKIFGIYNATFFLSWGLASTLITGPLVDSLILLGKDEIFSFQMAFYAGAIITVIGFGIFLLLESTEKK